MLRARLAKTEVIPKLAKQRIAGIAEQSGPERSPGLFRPARAFEPRRELAHYLGIVRSQFHRPPEGAQPFVFLTKSQCRQAEVAKTVCAIRTELQGTPIMRIRSFG